MFFLRRLFLKDRAGKFRGKILSGRKSGPGRKSGMYDIYWIWNYYRCSLDSKSNLLKNISVTPYKPQNIRDDQKKLAKTI